MVGLDSLAPGRSDITFHLAISIDGLVQDCSISITDRPEILQSCTKPSIQWDYVPHDEKSMLHQINVTVLHQNIPNTDKHKKQTKINYRNFIKKNSELHWPHTLYLSTWITLVLGWGTAVVVLHFLQAPLDSWDPWGKPRPVQLLESPSLGPRSGRELQRDTSPSDGTVAAGSAMGRNIGEREENRHTVWCCYNRINFFPNPHNRHPIAHPWVYYWIYILLVIAVLYEIFDHIITTPKCIYIL